jgi:CRISPR system Cascade subunit CasC
LGEPEIAYLLDQARELCAEAGTDAKAAAKLAKEHIKKHKDDFHAIKCGAGIDGAMFGRFISGDPEARVSAAVHVAHAFTVHAEAAETDYFTAVDELLTRDEGGSGHLGATELTSGLFYNYVVVDVPLLVSNLTGSKPEEWLQADKDIAGAVVKNFIHLMATVTPGAKLGSTAPYDHAGMVLAEYGERQPRTLANAFLDPVATGQPNLFGRTVQCLGDYVASMDAMYGNGETRLLACRDTQAAVPGAVRASVPELADKVAAAIAEAGRA